MVRPFNWAIHIARSQAGRAQQPANPQSLHLCHRRPNNIERSVRARLVEPIHMEPATTSTSIHDCSHCSSGCCSRCYWRHRFATCSCGRRRGLVNDFLYLCRWRQGNSQRSGTDCCLGSGRRGRGGRRSPEFGSKKHSGKRCNRWNY